MGQIYVPQVNTLLMLGVLALLVMFRTSSNLAAAYGIAVTGTMVITVLLLFVVQRRTWKWPLAAAAAVLAPFLLIDLTFLGANVLKFLQGGWFPVALAAGLILIMWTWRRGAQILANKAHLDSTSLPALIASLQKRPPNRARGTAVFLTSDPSTAPVALLHNLKHNGVLHERNVIMTVRTAETPTVPEERRVEIETLSPEFFRVQVHYGFMESPDLTAAMSVCRHRGLKFDLMSTSFFLGRRSVVSSATGGMPPWQDRLFIYLARNATNPTDFFRIPPGRVVEMGAQVAV